MPIFNKNQQDDPGQEPLELIALEPRVLYSAAPIPLDTIDSVEDVDLDAEDSNSVLDTLNEVDSSIDDISDAMESLLSDEQSAVTATSELIIVDTSLEGYEELVADILSSSDPTRNFEIVEIHEDENGIERLNQIFASRQGLDAVHLVSHGADGQLELGNSTLDIDTLNENQDAISQWRFALNHDADILIYGCEVAETQHGQAFVELLSEYTETDIAASVDLTGNSDLGGDWDFEFHVGQIEAVAAFSVDVQANWQGILEVDASSLDGTAGSLAVSENGDVVQAYTTDSISGNVLNDVYYVVSNQDQSETTGPIRINDTVAGEQRDVSVAVAANGNLVFVWTSDHTGTDGVYAKIIAHDGSVIESEFEIEAGGAGNATVDTDDAGNFVVVWQASNANDLDQGIFVQAYNPFGDTIGVTQTVNTTLTGVQSNPDVALNNNGRFVVVWDDYVDLNGPSSTFSRSFDVNYATQTVIGQNDEVNLSGVNAFDANFGASVDILESGAFAVAYTTDSTNFARSTPFIGLALAANETGIIAEVRDANGVQFSHLGPVLGGPNVTVNGFQNDPAIVILEDNTPGDLSDNVVIVAWEGESDLGDANGVYFREFLGDGTSVTGERFVVSTAVTGEQQHVAIDKYNEGTAVAIGFEGVNNGVDDYHFILSETINVAPDGGDLTFAVGEDIPHVFNQMEFTAQFQDAETDPFAGLRILSLPDTGTLMLNGQPAVIGDFVDLNALDSGQFQYVPPLDSSGSTSFEYVVNDGNRDSFFANSVTLNISSLNDAPMFLLNFSLEITPGSSGNVLGLSNLNGTDVDDVDDTLTLEFASPLVHGTLFNDGTEIGVNETFTLAELAAGLITYDHDGLSINPEQILFFLRDGGEDGVLPAQSLFNINIVGTLPTVSLSGQVLEDVDGNAQLDDARAFVNADVYLYQDGGDGVISSDDIFISNTTTDFTGRYNFDVASSNEVYWVVVDSLSLESSTAANPFQSYDNAWAEQTYGDGGAKIGGLTAGDSDDASQLITAQHVSQVAINGQNVADVDFGFSYNVVSNNLGGDAQDDDNIAGNGRSVQGSLRQFITNANTISGPNVLRFAPGTAADQDLGGDSWWRIIVEVALPEITDAGTVINGRAYDTDGVTLLNSNTLLHGFSGTVGVGADGVANTGDEAELTQLDAPELEIEGADGTDFGLVVRAENVEIAYLAIHGFGGEGADASSANILVDGDFVNIHDNLIGTGAGSYSALPEPASSTAFGSGVFVEAGDNGLISNNLLSFNFDAGIRFDRGITQSDWIISSNEIFSNGLFGNRRGEGVNLDATSGIELIGNLVADSGNHGIQFSNAQDTLIYQNTIQGNGTRIPDIFGIAIEGSSNNVIEGNLISDNIGTGVLVQSGSTGNEITKNSFFGNENIAIDNAVAGGADGVSENGIADDTGAGNDGFDQPELYTAYISGGELKILGNVDPTANIERFEIYVADAGPDDTPNGLSGTSFGEGRQFLGTVRTDSVSYVIDNTTGDFTISIINPPALSDSDSITFLAFEEGTANTSEFSNNIEINDIPLAIDSEVETLEDTVLIFASSDFDFDDSDALAEVIIESLPTNGTLRLNGMTLAIPTGVPTPLTIPVTIDVAAIDSGALTFEPEMNASGPAHGQFQFRVNDGLVNSIASAMMTINVTPEDDAPVAVNDDFMVGEDSVLSADLSRNLLANDIDVDMDALTIITTPVSGPSNGSVTINPDGTFTYTPNTDFNGTDSFTYQINDGNSTSRADVTINVTPENDAPVAVNDEFVVDEGGSISANVFSNDSDPDNDIVSYRLVAGPDIGALIWEGDGTFVYTHSGVEIFQTEFVYEAIDASGLTSQATVEIEVNPLDDAPIANDDVTQALTGASQDITDSILLNDRDVDSQIDGFTIVSQPENGEVVITNGRIIFTPDDGFIGDAVFQYSVVSNSRLSAPAEVVVQVIEGGVILTPERTEDDEAGDADSTSIDEIEGMPFPVRTDESDDNDDDEIGDFNNLNDADVGNQRVNRLANGDRFDLDKFESELSDQSLFSTYLLPSDVESIELSSHLAFETDPFGNTETLFASAFLDELDSAKFQFAVDFDITVPSIAMAGTSFLTVGYLAWMVRGGVLLTTFMSSIPAWRMLDPLAVLEAADGTGGDDSDDQSIGELVDS